MRLLCPYSLYSFCISSSMIKLSYNFHFSLRFIISSISSLLPHSVNLSRSMSHNWLFFALMLSFSLKFVLKFLAYLCSSLINDGNSSWLISESIRGLDMLFSLLLAIKATWSWPFFIFRNILMLLLLVRTTRLILAVYPNRCTNDSSKWVKRNITACIWQNKQSLVFIVQYCDILIECLSHLFSVIEFES